jgi:hypothetical protein
MQNDKTQDFARLNWIAALSFAGSVGISLALWVGLFRVLELLTN